MTTHWKGSSRDVTYIPESRLLRLDFSGRISVFDIGPVPGEYPELGRVRWWIAVLIFRHMQAAGFVTHFVTEVGKWAIIVHPFNIPEKQTFFPGAKGRMLPLELLFRHVITPKTFARVERGEIDRASIERLLVGSHLEVGAQLRAPFVECSTKHQAADDYVPDIQAAELAGIPLEKLLSVYEEVSRVAMFLQTLFRSAGFNLKTGKVEGALRDDGSFVICDAFSPDELQLTGPDGRSYDKDPLRQWYVDTYPVWYGELVAAKKEYPTHKCMWPLYPGPPSPKVIEDLTDRYRMVAEALGALEK